MALQNDFGTVHRAESGAGAESARNPAPAAKRRRHKPLNDIDQVRAQMARVYWRLEDGELDEDAAKSRTYILGKLVECLKVADGDLDARLDALLKKAESRIG